MADEVKVSLTSSQQKTEEVEGVGTMEATAEETASKEQLENDLAQEYLASSQELQNAREHTQPKEAAQTTKLQENTPQNAKEEPTALIEKHDYVNGEMNLEVIGYFDASYKRRFLQAKEKKTIVLSRGRTIHVVPSTAYGLPNAEDLDFYRAFQKIYEEYVEEHPDWTPKDPIVFSTRKLFAYAKKRMSGRDWKAAREWVHRQAATSLEGAVFLGKKKEYATGIVGGAFAKALVKGDLLPNGETAETNYIYLADWYASNLREGHYTTLIDRSTHYGFKKATAKVLCPILYQAWHASKGLPVTYGYRSLAQRLGLPPQKHLARIKQQLDPSHNEMEQRKSLALHNYQPSADGKDWNITYAPGEAFFKYRKERRARKQLAEQIQQTKQQPALPLPSPLQEPDTPTLEGKTITEMAKNAIELERIKKEIRGKFGKQKEIL